MEPPDTSDRRTRAPAGARPGGERGRRRATRRRAIQRRAIQRRARAAAVAVALLAVAVPADPAPGATRAARPADEAPRPIPAAELLAAASEELAALAPEGIWVAVDTWDNRLRVMRGGETLREATCSTGSGRRLADPASDRVWRFDSPLGERRVLRKESDPVWIKPDWAFVEEGLAVPTDPAERRDEVSFGDYALYLGDGYVIHGTLFPSLLGRRATHGCVRLGDDDLEYVYRHVPVGARVLLY